MIGSPISCPIVGQLTITPIRSVNFEFTWRKLYAISFVYCLFSAGFKKHPATRDALGTPPGLINSLYFSARNCMLLFGL